MKRHQGYHGPGPIKGRRISIRELMWSDVDMSRQIIRQPNGRFSIFSTITDSFIFTDLTENQVRQEFIKDAMIVAQGQVNTILKGIKAGAKPYLHNTVEYDEAVELDAANSSPEDVE